MNQCQEKLLIRPHTDFRTIHEQREDTQNANLSTGITQWSKCNKTITLRVDL